MITISKSLLKARMLEYFRKVEEQGEELVVTSHRKPVIKVCRLAPHNSVSDVFRDVRGRARLPQEVVMASETSEWGELV